MADSVLLSMRQVEIFRATMKFGTVTAAAEALGSSQPTVSRELRRLESHIGFALFERKRQRLKPTARALKLYHEVQAAFIGLDEINACLHRLREAHGEMLQIASLPAFAQTILPEAVARLSRDLPNLTVEIDPVDPLNQSPVSGFNFDIGLIEEGYSEGNAEALAVGTLREVCVMPEGHALAAKEEIAPKDFGNYPFVALSPNDPYRRRYDRLLEAAGVVPRVQFTSRSAGTVCDLVSRGLGVAIVNPLSALDYMERGLVARRFSPAIPFTISALRPTNRPAVEAGRRLLDILRDLCREKAERLVALGLMT